MWKKWNFVRSWYLKAWLTRAMRIAKNILWVESIWLKLLVIFKDNFSLKMLTVLWLLRRSYADDWEAKWNPWECPSSCVEKIFSENDCENRLKLTLNLSYYYHFFIIRINYLIQTGFIWENTKRMSNTWFKWKFQIGWKLLFCLSLWETSND